MMRFEPLQKKQSLISRENNSQCCDCNTENKTSGITDRRDFEGLDWIEGFIETPAGTVPVVSSKLTMFNMFEQFRARTSSFRMSFSVKPGLYAAGKPVPSSDIFVTANYRLSFDHLRVSLSGMNAWILVLDTKGINVWCAAGKGTFGTDELVTRIKASGIERCVEHRKIILPQLGAPGVNSGEVRKRTGFRILYGPVLARNIKKYVDNGYSADPEMRRVRFSMSDRAVLIPMELRMVIDKFFIFALIVLIYAGVEPRGIIFRNSVADGYPLLLGGVLAVVSGAVITPLLLPLIPFRSFALKGWIAGFIMFLSLNSISDIFSSQGGYIEAATLILFPMLSSYIALQFTGASTFTSLSGVQKEIKYTLPIYIGGFIVSTLLLVISKISEWGYL